MKPSEIKVGRCYANKSETTICRVDYINPDSLSGTVLVTIIKAHANANFADIWDLNYFARWADHKIKEPQVVEEKERNDG